MLAYWKMAVTQDYIPAMAAETNETMINLSCQKHTGCYVFVYVSKKSQAQL